MGISQSIIYKMIDEILDSINNNKNFIERKLKSMRTKNVMAIFEGTKDGKWKSKHILEYIKNNNLDNHIDIYSNSYQTRCRGLYERYKVYLIIGEEVPKELVRRSIIGLSNKEKSAQLFFISAMQDSRFKLYEERLTFIDYPDEHRKDVKIHNEFIRSSNGKKN